ncbi:ATP-binding cassette domain-containing protein [Aquipuribacter nitratireducens]|uniref:ATP-binding cassette domain-containing protein n=1 Tax=Aquipuribacter nitratireducens TaxID=650104 RepID=A0ABW0GUA4_9MICO
MRLLTDLWATSPGRTALVGVLVLVGAGGRAGAAALAGPVLVDRSVAAFSALVVCLVGAVLAALVGRLVLAGLSADWAADVRRRACRVAFAQELTRLEHTPVGELLDRIDHDMHDTAALVRNQGLHILTSILTAVLAVVTALVVWWPAGVALAALSVLLVVVLRPVALRIGPLREREEAAWSDLAAVMEEGVHGQDDVRTTLAQPYVTRLYAQRASQVLARGKEVWRLSAVLVGGALGMVAVALALLVVSGAALVGADRLTAAALTSVWVLALGFAGTVSTVSHNVAELQNALGAWTRVRLLLDSPQEPTGGHAPRDGDIEVRGLTFRYPDDPDGPPALRDVHLAFRRGRSYAVVGRTGAGKSTLSSVLTRAVPVPRGAVFLRDAEGETDLVDVDLQRLRRVVAVVPQRTEILAGTLAENVALFDPDLLPRVPEVLRELGLDAWVAELPDGLDTRLGDGGHALSAGQAQLVAFARILVRDPRVVVLDEATARMDPVTEARVRAATDRLLADRIGIVVAHRLSSVSRCDEVVVLADGRVVEAGPLADSRRFAELLATAGGARDLDLDADAALGLDPTPAPTVSTSSPPTVTPPGPARGPAAQRTPRARPWREIARLCVNDPRLGLVAIAAFSLVVVFGFDGSVLAWLWTDLVDGTGSLVWPAVGIVTALLLPVPASLVAFRRFPEWWVTQMLRLGLRLLRGQTGPRRVSRHQPAEVVAQTGDTERVVVIADNLYDQALGLGLVVVMTVVSGSVVPGLFFLGTMVVSGLVALAFGSGLHRLAGEAIATRAAFASSLASSLAAARTVKLSGATPAVLAHLARLDDVRSATLAREVRLTVWASAAPPVLSGLLPVVAWSLYLRGELSSTATFVAVTTLGAAQWFGYTTASIASRYPSARVWLRRATEMAGVDTLSRPVPGVDLARGTAPAPEPPPRVPLQRLELRGFTSLHDDGVPGARDVDLVVDRGELVLLVGPVGSGKSSLLRALAGILRHDGTLRWNGETVADPASFLRPQQVGYVSQLPRVLSGTIAENVHLGHAVEVEGALSTAQLDRDVASAGGLATVIGHKGVRLSGGQLQRLALARALAPRTELLVADDVSSALDVETELDLWQALRERGTTVVGSTSKRAALERADRVVVMVGGVVVAQGPWSRLQGDWGRLAG